MVAGGATDGTPEADIGYDAYGWNWAAVVREVRPSPEIDTSRPSIARVYDAALGGKDNDAVDRAVVEEALKIAPGVATGAAPREPPTADPGCVVARAGDPHARPSPRLVGCGLQFRGQPAARSSAMQPVIGHHRRSGPFRWNSPTFLKTVVA
jgi:hypothetical protein